MYSVRLTGAFLLGYFIFEMRLSILKGVECMSIKGLRIKGLDTVDVSLKLEKYVAEYFTGYALGIGQSMFMEAYFFHFSEVKEMIPVNHHHLFTENDRLIGMSGYISLNDNLDERVIMMLTDEHGEYAYLLYLQSEDENGNTESVIIKDFLAE